MSLQEELEIMDADIERAVKRLRAADEYAKRYARWLFDRAQPDPGCRREYRPDFASETALAALPPTRHSSK